MEELPVIFLGQYEAIFKQYTFTNNIWTHKVKCWIVPKDGGIEIIISDLQSLQFGFGYP